MASASPVVEQVLSETLRVVTLCRPKKLNALDLEMVREVTKIFRGLPTKPVAVVMRGEGKAFCAGGDVAAVRRDGLDGGNLRYQFFGEEYLMNSLLGQLGSPTSLVKQISLWNGVVMGGGAGISAHGRFRVATENAIFAMPETAIGLFPDVGAAHYLRRMPRSTGVYAGLTGARLDAADLLYSGLATHFVPAAKLEDILTGLHGVSSSSDALAFDNQVEAAIQAVAEPPQNPSKLEALADDIDAAFRLPTVEAIIDHLTKANTKFGQDTVKTLSTMSPTSLKVTLANIRRDSPDLDATLKTDLRLALTMTDPKNQPDFYEGIRALLVDKDKNPHWRPPSLADVDDDAIQRHFAPFTDDVRNTLASLDLTWFSSD